MKLVEDEIQTINLLCGKCGRVAEVDYEPGTTYQCSKCGGAMMLAGEKQEHSIESLSGMHRRED